MDLLVGRSGTEPKTLDYAAIAKAKVEVEFSAPSAQVLALLDAETAQKFDQDVQVSTRRRRGSRSTMNVDITALRAVEKEKGIEFDSLIETLETALLTAYRHTHGHQRNARVEVDRKSGNIRVLAAEVGEHGEAGPEFDDTPDDFGRIAATTARQVPATPA